MTTLSFDSSLRLSIEMLKGKRNDAHKKLRTVKSSKLDHSLLRFKARTTKGVFIVLGMPQNCDLFEVVKFNSPVSIVSFKNHKICRRCYIASEEVVLLETNVHGMNLVYT